MTDDPRSKTRLVALHDVLIAASKASLSALLHDGLTLCTERKMCLALLSHVELAPVTAAVGLGKRLQRLARQIASNQSAMNAERQKLQRLENVRERLLSQVHELKRQLEWLATEEQIEELTSKLAAGSRLGQGLSDTLDGDEARF